MGAAPAVAGRKDVDDALAVVAVRDALIHRHLPRTWRRIQTRAVRGAPTVVRHRRVCHVVGHRSDQVAVGAGPQGVGAVDRRTRSDSPAADRVVARRDDAGHRGAVGTQRIEKALPAVVLAADRVHVVDQVRMAFVQSVVHDRYRDALAPVASGPDLLHADVLARCATALPLVSQVPLTPVEGVAELRRKARTTGHDVVHLFVFHHANRIADRGERRQSAPAGEGHLDVVGASVQSTREREAL